jgi:periplasmic divalent cation tolerance protein
MAARARNSNVIKLRRGTFMTACVMVLVTCKSSTEARGIARAMVTSRLAACANVLPGKIESIYRWRGKVERARETLLLLKTTRGRWPKLRDAIRRAHSYDVPEIVAMPIVAGLNEYLEWIGESVE